LALQDRFEQWRLGIEIGVADRAPIDQDNVGRSAHFDIADCVGGDCGASHSDDAAKCYPLKVEIHRPHERALAGWQSPLPNKYSRWHGTR